MRPSGCRHGRRLVLVVDDEADNRRILSRALGRLPGVVVEEARNGFAALRMVGTLEPDLVILDMDMPVLDGYHVARALRDSGAAAARVPIIALTAAISREEHRRCVDAGVDDWLAKPITDLDALRSNVTAWLAAGTRRAPTPRLRAPMTERPEAAH